MASTKKRCTECRCWYAPSGRAVKTQRICGAACRTKRRRRRARPRRGREGQAARGAERERQRRWRAAQRANPQVRDAARGHVTAICHAPASDSRYAEWQEKVRETVDRVVDLSRATLYRLVPRILGDLARSEIAARTEGGP